MHRKKKPRIVLAEDDALVAESVKNFLSEWYEVEVARNGEAAVLSCQANAPDLVLMDLMMPHSPAYEGDEAIRRLTADPRTSSIPIIIQTGFEDSRLLGLMAKSSNIAGLLLKPFDLALLKKKIEVALGRR